MCTPCSTTYRQRVNDHRRADEDRPLRAQLELYLEREPISGRLRPERGADEEFVGWLGFVDALKRLHDPERKEQTVNTQATKPTLVLGGTGKTGRRVAERLAARSLPVRIGSRAGEPPFDWEDDTTWAPALEGVRAVYISYYPDLAVPGAVDATRSFAEVALSRGVRRLALLSGRGEPLAEQAEEAVRDTGADLTILRSTWFMQNFSEDYMLDHLLSGEIRLPAGEVPTPFLDIDDLADIAAEALTDDRHVGELYELTGPRSLTFAQAAAEISEAAGGEIRYTPVSLEQHAAELAEHGVAPEFVEFLTYLFKEVVDGRNADTTDGVKRALGREPRDFADYVRETAASGVWNASPASA
jgi:uncharacterized protein YbjT (DUF2867 family)